MSAHAVLKYVRLTHRQGGRISSHVMWHWVSGATAWAIYR